LLTLKRQEPNGKSVRLFIFGRGKRIRTSGPCVPNAKWGWKIIAKIKEKIKIERVSFYVIAVN